MTESKYYAVFFNVDYPAIRKNALVLKIDKNKFDNLIDEAVPGKTVELKFKDGEEKKYEIESRQNFWTDEYSMIEGQQSNCFIICNVKKVKSQNNVNQ